MRLRPDRRLGGLLTPVIRDSILGVYPTNEVCTATTIDDDVSGGQSPQPHSFYWAAIDHR